MASAATKENIETARAMYDAFNSGDLETVMSNMADDAEWIEHDGSRFAGTHRGPDAILANVFAPVMEGMETFEAKTERFIEDGDTVVVLGSNEGVVAETGNSLSAKFAHVCEFEDGKMTRFENYTDTHAWERAYGE
ncbi:nuclear transport factor 2 family protein [Halobaculum limi]|uniref:nuclear transport factor 2 family protein n=1 Tax=Halobaculum limi TaxID=3031916 RepID=UPI0024061F9D|nr:nuclear transport factor 2 family protein [Halobaculum sp. YSMS11]